MAKERETQEFQQASLTIAGKQASGGKFLCAQSDTGNSICRMVLYPTQEGCCKECFYSNKDNGNTPDIEDINRTFEDVALEVLNELSKGFWDLVVDWNGVNYTSHDEIIVVGRKG